MSSNSNGVIFNRRPNKEDIGIRYEVIRTPEKGIKNLIVLGHDITGVETHYFSGRTTPCGNDNCPACDDGNAKRWHGYITVWEPKTRSPAIFEFTAAASVPLDRYFKDHRTLRGSTIEAKRVPARANGRVVIKLSKWAGDHDVMPKGPNVEKILLKMWDMTKFETMPQEVQRKIRDDKDQGSDFGDSDVLPLDPQEKKSA